MLTACPFRSADVLIYKILSRSEWTAARAVVFVRNCDGVTVSDD